MYINKIDELIDNTIDIFYNNIQHINIFKKLYTNNNFFYV